MRRNRVVFFGISKQSNDRDDHAIKKTFRVRSGNNIVILSPILITKFCHIVDKLTVLNRSTQHNLEVLPNNNRLHGVSVAPDLSFKERKKYKALKQEMININEELQTSSSTSEKWIVKKCNL
ncbi:unnamed protein product [Meganyctiphanes norvegica]|uniref:Uncharacterized protein n=1 Tax=Meganyctiphanes norvegica TaxID=48144 RepID=A0AAV2QP19_MEGNR